MLMEVISSLRGAGFSVRRFRDPQTPADGGADTLVEVSDGDRRWLFAVEEKRRAPYPNEVTDLDLRRVQLEDSGEPMLIAPFITEGTGDRLTEAGWSWADLEGNFRLKARGLFVYQRRPRGRQAQPKTIPQGRGGLVIVRTLIAFVAGETAPLDVTRLARQAGVTQPRASQVLGRLRSLGLVEKVDGYWWPEREALLDRFLSEYRGPGGPQHYFYSLADPGDVAVSATKGSSPPYPILISADVGPDLYAPWLRPRIVLLYSRADHLPQDIGLVEAVGPSDANVIVRHPHDLSVFAQNKVGRLKGEDIPVVDTAQMIWDLQQLGGADRLEAAGRLREWLLNR